MQRTAPITPDIEEHAPGLYRRMGIYAPFVWMAVMVLRVGMRVGVISPDFFMPSRADVTSVLYDGNRQLRRARACCLRRARRCMVKHGKISPENYTPRAYAHLAYVSMMDKTINAGQFFERYIRDNGLSRVEVFGLDGAHRITGFSQNLTLSEMLSGLCAKTAAVMGLSPLSLSAPVDPAPP